MGTKCASAVATVVMGDFENKHVYTHAKPLFVWFGLVDHFVSVGSMVQQNGPGLWNISIRFCVIAHQLEVLIA